MIRLHLGGVVIHLNADALADVVNAQGPKWLVPPPGERLSAEDEGMRLAMKGTIKTVLWWMRKKMRHQGVPEAMQPNVPKGADSLMYGMSYLLWYITEVAEQFEYKADYRELENGDLEITGMAARAVSVASAAGTGSADSGRLALPDTEAAGGASTGDAAGVAV